MTLKGVVFVFLFTAATLQPLEAEDEQGGPMVNEPSHADLGGIGIVGFRFFASSYPPHWGEEQIEATERTLRERILKGGVPIVESEDAALPYFSIGAYVRHTNSTCIYDLTSGLREPVRLRRPENPKVVFAGTWEGKFAMDLLPTYKPRRAGPLSVTEPRT